MASSAVHVIKSFAVRNLDRVFAALFCPGTNPPGFLGALTAPPVCGGSCAGFPGPCMGLDCTMLTTHTPAAMSTKVLSIRSLHGAVKTSSPLLSC